MEDHHSAAAKVRVNGAPAEATLSTGAGVGGPELRWRYCAGPAAERSLSLEADVLGVEANGKEVVVRAFVAAGKRRRRRDYVFEMADGEGAAAAWGEKLRRCLDSFGRPKRLFVLVNPFGGKRCASKIYEAEIKPMLEAAGVDVTMQETQHGGHARELATSLDLARYDGIVCVSGDGVLVEVVNGILQRTDWEEAIKMPIGIIPAGTGNGMAKSLLHAANQTCSISEALFAIIRGHKQALDVCTLVQGQKKIFSVLSVTWGLVADIDIESEKYRWMGSARFDFYALVRIMNLRRYCGTIHFVPAPGYEAYGEPAKQVESSIVECLEQNGEPQVCSYQGPSAELQGSYWRSIDGPFVAVCLNNVPWATESVMAAPEAKFSDGYMDAVIIRDCPKADLLALMLKMSDGSYVKSKYVTYLKVRSFRLSPGQLVENPKRGGIIDVDGEVIARGEEAYGRNKNQDVMAYGPSVQMTVHQGLATVYCPK
ncbi:sphingosine kinase 2-like [Lolium rigidum]|uniref:sphingosine kinase 2-like n=1 Tax=Lolium rigidum TaxID=89674 RepID=UPI001F5D3EAB|nr:sphingosine kinase 2-like [Lolium rigidum]